jgi:hypothetical protein
MIFSIMPLRWAYAIRVLMAALLLSAQLPLFAGEGHSHDPAPAAASGSALPRFSAHSDLFEAVGVLNAAELSVLIDRYETNEPVLNAKVEIESGSFKSVAAFHSEHGDYSAPAQAFRKAGTYPITLTVMAGDQTDLLTGELVVPEPDAGFTHAAPGKPWGLWLAIATGLLGLVATVGWRVRRPNQSKTRPASL